MDDSVSQTHLVHLNTGVKEGSCLFHLSIMLFNHDPSLADLLRQRCVHQLLLRLLLHQLHWADTANTEEGALVLDEKPFTNLNLKPIRNDV